MINSDNIFSHEFDFIPYQSVGILNFKEDDNEIKSKLGKIKSEFNLYGGGKSLEFENYDDIEIYLDSNNKFDGIHFYKSLKFLLNGKVYEIDFDKFSRDDLKDIADDFVEADIEEGISCTSKKLGIDFYFNDSDDDVEFLEAVLFMSKDYYEREIKY